MKKKIEKISLIRENEKQPLKTFPLFHLRWNWESIRMTTITLYGGANEIGGNKVLLEDGDTRIFIDFGMSFSHAERFFSEFLQPRKCNGILDFLELGMLPDIKGIYRSDYLKHIGRPEEERSVDGILLSHAHTDHCQYIHHLREDIPLFCSKESLLIMKALEETGASVFSDFTCIKESFKIREQKSKPGLFTRIKGEEAKKPRKIEIIENGKPFKIGSIEIIPISVDHSLPGAMAYIIHTSDKTIVYSGDFRFHGRNSTLTEKFVQTVAEDRPDVLLCEGTKIDESKTETEDDVEKRVEAIVSKTKALSVVNYPTRDIDRMLSFLNAARKSGRRLVIDMKQAYILDLFDKEKLNAPRLTDPSIAVFAPRKGWGLIGRTDYPQEIVYQDYERWERDFLEKDNILTYKEINANQKDFIFYCNNFQLQQLIDVKPSKGSTYIRSMCEPFNEEMELDMERVKNWLKHFSLLPIHQIHVSGHANRDDLKKMINMIKPRVLIPIHTQKPKSFKAIWKGKVGMVKVGEMVRV
jgi:ribonuclease J